jgi:hypothetical protein
MTEGEVLVSGGEASENGEFIFRRLPPWMPTTESDGNFKLLDVVGRGFDRLDGDIQQVDKATSVQKAENKESIREIARLIEEPPKKDETVDEYRLRVIASFQKITSEGTLDGIFGNIATLLDISPERITYEDLDTNGEILLGVPGEGIENVSLTTDEFSNTIREQSAAGFRINVKNRGSFTYLGAEYYSGSGSYDSADLESNAEYGHDGLDESGNPKGNGGTYAGVLN